jgi:hypothetical protein
MEVEAIAFWMFFAVGIQPRRRSTPDGTAAVRQRWHAHQNAPDAVATTAALLCCDSDRGQRFPPLEETRLSPLSTAQTRGGGCRRRFEIACGRFARFDKHLEQQAIWRWVGRSSMRRSSPRPSSASVRPRRRTSRRARVPDDWMDKPAKLRGQGGQKTGGAWCRFERLDLQRSGRPASLGAAVPVPRCGPPLSAVWLNGRLPPTGEAFGRSFQISTIRGKKIHGEARNFPFSS